MVRPKKFLGQHFLKNRHRAEQIANAVSEENSEVLEVGPGTGVLTQYLMTKSFELKVIEIDNESIVYLKEHYPQLEIIEGDFLKLDLRQLYTDNFAIAGNFPYNISSQIFFKVLEHRHQVTEVVGMIQKEVADRIVSPPGNKTYGILSVLLQAYYNITYLFTVKPGEFFPPPKVNSAVIRLKRNHIEDLPCDERLFFRLVKQAFQMRRKTLRNALKPLNLPPADSAEVLLDKRAEQLSVDQFIYLTQLYGESGERNEI